MKKIGLIAGSGTLPVEFARSARKRGEKVIVFAVKGMTSPLLDEEVDKIYWLDFGQYAKFVFFLLKERVNRLALLGKFRKEAIYRDMYDKERQDFFKTMENKEDYTLLEGVTKRLGKLGVKVIDPSGYLSHIIPGKGVLTRHVPDAKLEEDIEFGYAAAKKLSGMDIGQAVVVKGKTVVAVEAMEGTDATIERGRRIAGDGCVAVKVSRPDQDMRWDTPTVGPVTMENLAANNFKALAIESGKMYLLEKEKLLEIADSKGIIVKVL